MLDTSPAPPSFHRTFEGSRQQVHGRRRLEPHLKRPRPNRCPAELNENLTSPIKSRNSRRESAQHDRPNEIRSTDGAQPSNESCLPPMGVKNLCLQPLLESDDQFVVTCGHRSPFVVRIRRMVFLLGLRYLFSPPFVDPSSRKSPVHHRYIVSARRDPSCHQPTAATWMVSCSLAPAKDHPHASEVQVDSNAEGATNGRKMMVQPCIQFSVVSLEALKGSRIPRRYKSIAAWER